MEEVAAEYQNDNKEKFKLESIPPLPGVIKEGVTEEDWQKFEELSFDYLISRGFIEQNEQGQLVADLEKISAFSIKDFSKSLPSQKQGGIAWNKRQQIASNTTAVFANLFHDREVLVKGVDSEPRPLVYIPENEESLSDISAMRNSWMSLNEIGLTQDYSVTYPTKEKGAGSELDLIDVAPVYLVYAVGNGKRDENGNLFVDRDVNDPDAGRMQVTGEWFRRNGFRGPTDAKFGENTSNLFQKYGKRWEESGLLSQSDFPEASRLKKDRTISNGRVTIDDHIFYLGRDYKEGKLEPITNHEYIIYDNAGNPVAILDKDLDQDKITETTAISREVKGNEYRQTVVNKPAVSISKIEQLGEYTNIRTYGNEKVREKVSIQRELSGLLDLRQGLPDELRDNLQSFSLKEQINLARSLRKLGEIGDSRGLDFLEKTGRVGMQILIEAESRSGLDHRLLDLKDFDEDKREELLTSYETFRASIGNLGDTLLEQAQQKGLDNTSKILVHRVKEALLSRSTDFLLADMDQGSNEMKKLGQALTSVDNIINGRIEYKMEPGEDKQTNAKQARYKLENGSELNIVVRPEESEHAQARISFVYRDSEGTRTDLRLDHDEFGLSVDIARRKTQLHETLTDLGKSHHTQSIFEKGLMDGKEFKKLAENMPVILGWS